MNGRQPTDKSTQEHADSNETCTKLCDSKRGGTSKIGTNTDKV